MVLEQGAYLFPPNKGVHITIKEESVKDLKIVYKNVGFCPEIA